MTQAPSWTCSPLINSYISLFEGSLHHWHTVWLLGTKCPPTQLSIISPQEQESGLDGAECSVQPRAGRVGSHGGPTLKGFYNPMAPELKKETAWQSLPWEQQGQKSPQ